MDVREESSEVQQVVACADYTPGSSLTLAEPSAIIRPYSLLEEILHRQGASDVPWLFVGSA
ncbi:MAG: hypothetical protein R6X33_07175, partial [Candidatus Brocadiia bacterium]